MENRIIFLKKQWSEKRVPQNPILQDLLYYIWVNMYFITFMITNYNY